MDGLGEVCVFVCVEDPPKNHEYQISYMKNNTIMMWLLLVGPSEKEDKKLQLFVYGMLGI
jgi:hypothetical protein